MTVLATLDFDAIAEGTTIGNGSTALSPFTVTSTLSSPAVALAAAAVNGARGLSVPAAVTGFFQAIWTEAANSLQRVIAFDYTPQGNTVDTFIATVLDASATPANVGQIRLKASDGTVNIRNGTTQVATSAAGTMDFSGATTYRFEWMMKAGTAGQELRVYEAGSTTLLFAALTGAMTTSSRKGFYFGKGAAANGSGGYFDNVRIADDWVGPYSPAPVGGLTIVDDRLVVLGDSLTNMLGNGVTYLTNALAARGWDPAKVEVSGITGRNVWGGSTHPTAEESIDTWRADLIDARNWLVALGANNQSASQSTLQGYFLNLLTKIGPGRRVHFIDQGFQAQAENLWNYNAALAVGARYTKNGTTGVSEVNAAIRNVADIANASPGTYPVCTVHNWNDDATMRAAGSSIWNVGETTSIGGTARHMVDAGYSGYRAPFMAAMMDAELPVSPNKAAFIAFL